MILICPGVVAKVQPPFFSSMPLDRALPGSLPVANVSDPVERSRSYSLPRHSGKSFIANDPLGLREATCGVSFSLDMYLRRARKYVRIDASGRIR